MMHSKSATLQNAATATGNGNTFDVSGLVNVSLQIFGTFVGTVTFEASNDGGTTWATVGFLNSSNTNATTASAAGIFTSYNTGYLLLRVRVSAYTSGTITVIAAGSG